MPSNELSGTSDPQEPPSDGIPASASAVRWTPPPGWVPPPGWKPPRNGGKRRMWVAASCAALALALVGGGAFVIVERQNSQAAQERADAAAAAKAEAEEDAAAEEAAELAAQEQRDAEREAAKLAEAGGAYSTCQRQLGGLSDALAAIDSRLDVGLTQSDLSTYVGDASVAYGRIRVSALGDGACLSAAAKLETAFNEYSSSSSDWNDCIIDFGCDTDSILPGMRLQWSKASKLIRQSRRLVKTMDPDGNAYRPESAGAIGA